MGREGALAVAASLRSREETGRSVGRLGGFGWGPGHARLQRRGDQPSVFSGRIGVGPSARRGGWQLQSASAEAKLEGNCRYFGSVVAAAKGFRGITNATGVSFKASSVEGPYVLCYQFLVRRAGGITWLPQSL